MVSAYFNNLEKKNMQVLENITDHEKIAREHPDVPCTAAMCYKNVALTLGVRTVKEFYDLRQQFAEDALTYTRPEMLYLDLEYLVSILETSKLRAGEIRNQHKIVKRLMPCIMGEKKRVLENIPADSIVMVVTKKEEEEYTDEEVDKVILRFVKFSYILCYCLKLVPLNDSSGLVISSLPLSMDNSAYMSFIVNAINKCEMCANRGRSFCALCKQVRYCSKACQVSHWHDIHKSECPRKLRKLHQLSDGRVVLLLRLPDGVTLS
jgi:hypothetical protein